MSDNDSGFSDYEQLENDLNDILHRYEEAARRERRTLLLKIVHPIDCHTPIKIATGLSAAWDFTPVVRLSSKVAENINLSFNMMEWIRFVEKLQETLNDDYEINATQQWINEIEVTVTRIGDENNFYKLVEIKQNDVLFYFRTCEILEILNFEKLIIKRLENLQKLEFCNFYYVMLSTLHNIMIDKSLAAFQDAVLTFCNMNNTLESYCLYECIYYFKDKLFSDFENYKF